MLQAPLYLKYSIPAAFFIFILLWESRFPFFRGRTGRCTHASRNMALFAVNAILITLPLTPLIIWVNEAIHMNRWGLSPFLSLPAWLKIIILIIAFDLWMYLWHRMNHRADVLWRFHRVHHSDPAMDVTTALRFHGGELLISALLRVGIFFILGMDLIVLYLYESIMLPVVYFHHGNVNLPGAADRALRMIIVTPGMHRVHHSDIRAENNMNFGSLFSWWDRLFGSYMIRGDIGAVRFGLDDLRDERSQSVAGMLTTPFRRR